MGEPLTKLRFHLALYAARLWPLPDLEPPPASPPDRPLACARKVFFWTPISNAGANVLVHDIMPTLQSAAAQHAPGWHITAGPTVPDGLLDALICFKAAPSAEARKRSRRTLLLICDQADVHWKLMPEFDGVVATSSQPFVALLRRRHPRVIFIPESEPLNYLVYGASHLRVPPSRRPAQLLWHGGDYSLGALLDLRPELTHWAKGRAASLRIISGRSPDREEFWGELHVRRSPWSKESLIQAAAKARLGLIPARTSLKNSWLKPASRVRCLFALGVPAIGDRRVPDVRAFAEACSGPLAEGRAEWLHTLNGLWEAPTELDALAQRGHSVVEQGWSATQTAFRWLRHLDSECRTDEGTGR